MFSKTEMSEIGKMSCLLKHEDVIYQHIIVVGTKVLNVKLKSNISLIATCLAYSVRRTFLPCCPIIGVDFSPAGILKY